MNKSIKNLLILAIATFSLNVMAEDIPPVKAAELACHRVDRLVVLKKIDKSYLSKFQTLQLVELPSNDPSGGKYQVTANQTAPHHGNPLSVSVLIDPTGKVLKHQVYETGSLGPEIAWPGKDPISLAEAGLHYVLDEHLKNEQLRPFAMDFQSLVLLQKPYGSGKLAEMTLFSSTTTAKLILKLDLNGKLLQKEVVP